MSGGSVPVHAAEGFIEQDSVFVVCCDHPGTRADAIIREERWEGGNDYLILT